MLPSTHIATGVLMFTIAYAAGVSPLLSLFVVIGAVLPDADYLINRKHRTQITHAPLLWIAVLTPLAVFLPQFLFLEIGVVVHFLLDTMDWGVMWKYPHKNTLHGGLMRKKNIRSDFIHHYLSHNGLVALELVFLSVALVSSYFVLL